MARRTQNNDGKSTKRPKQTLDLDAKDVSEPVKDELLNDKTEAKAEAKTSDQDSKNAQNEPKMNKSPEKKENIGKKDAGDTASLDDGVSSQASEGDEKVAEGSFFKTLVAALLGALLALVGQQFVPKLVTRGDVGNVVTVQQLQEKIQALESQISLGSKDDFDLLGQRMDQVEKNQNDDALAGFSERLGKLEGSLSDLAKTAKAGDERIEGVAALVTKMNGLETKVGKELGEVRTRFANQLRGEVTKLSRVVATQESLTQIEGVKLTATTLGKRLAVIEARSNQLITDLSSLSTKLEGVRSQSVSREALQKEIESLKTNIAGLDGQVGALKKFESDAHEMARRSALALAFANLKQTMERGSGFANELDAVKRLSGTSDDLANDFAQLDRLSNEGLSSEQTLIAGFSDLATEAIAATNQTPDASAWDKMVGKARGALRFRRTGDVQGETTEAVLARMEYKFKAGHSEDVLTQANALDPRAQQVMAPWLTKIKARVIVEQAMIKLEDQLLTSLQPREF